MSMSVLPWTLLPLVARLVIAQNEQVEEEEEGEEDDREQEQKEGQNVPPRPAGAAEPTPADEEPSATPAERVTEPPAEETPPSEEDERTPVLPTSTGDDEEPEPGESESTSTAETTSIQPPTPVSTAAITNAPSLTTSNSVFRLTGAPTLAGVGIPTQVVPYTGNAPFMQKSNLPEGTVFIGVGAFLAFCVVGLFLWRILVAWALHRSVRRAAMQHTMPESKAMLRPPGSTFYSAGPGSSLSLDRLAATTGKPISKPDRSSVAPSAAARSSLFFSPTAAGTGGPHSLTNRSSGYLPAGYYAAGNSAAAGGAPMTHIGGGGGGGALTNPLSTLSAQAAGYQRARSMGTTPPASPGLPPSRGPESVTTSQRLPSRGVDTNGYARVSGVANGIASGSTSSLNLTVPPQGRAPSAYLEDLFASHGTGPR